ncbi:MAG: class I SAM-dependent methyltransferase [candidate division KSB1 bacterium]|nr:class I SAM-dependent methyltransferase [candidate division KSB1 bacterium]MDZ7273471.1 class I SAM-dependent methyltransferase [candidate division KSB1 bacterium]MDZ7286937.1 class I SAM-dependent methyltransferase [candidate division KSB1 bacterium]MDZ7299710.1 class I SAM-dependent methyltransferase [candidate division KSB1 bacterium]MDZ7305649.1 class I SAM-dependent methyltransferase [candidate division KSB1 bacterium]
MQNIQHHFLQIAPRYRDLRLTDLAPITYIAEGLQTLPEIMAADVGCGAGRYDLKLFEQLGGRLQLYCFDASPAMLRELRAYLQQHNVHNFAVIHADAHKLPLPAASLHCLFTFNAIHHFKLGLFLNEVRRVLRDRGHLFIYTRLRSQNRRTIWGKYFPGFSQKETRLYELDELRRLINQQSHLQLQAVEFFKFERVCDLPELRRRVRQRHYSTFCLYEQNEFNRALREFERRLRLHYRDLGNIRWFDENVLLTLRRSRRPPGITDE